MDLGREVVQEQAEGLVTDRVGDQVVVVQDQHQRRPHRGQVVDQRRHHHPLQLHASAAQRPQGDGPHPRLNGPQRRHQIAPEAGRVVIDSHPMTPRPPACPRPPGPTGPTGSSCRTRPARPAGTAWPASGLEQRLEPGPRKEPGARGRRRQLGPQQLRAGRAGHIAGVILDRGRELGSIHHNPGCQGDQHTDQQLRLSSSVQQSWRQPAAAVPLRAPNLAPRTDPRGRLWE